MHSAHQGNQTIWEVNETQFAPLLQQIQLKTFDGPIRESETRVLIEGLTDVEIDAFTTTASNYHYKLKTSPPDKEPSEESGISITINDDDSKTHFYLLRILKQGGMPSSIQCLYCNRSNLSGNYNHIKPFNHQFDQLWTTELSSET